MIASGSMTAPDGAALVWYSVWDDQPSRIRFVTSTVERLQKKRPLGYRLETTQPTIDGKPGVRLVLAPVRWPGWDNLPTVHVVKARSLTFVARFQT